MRCMCDYLWVIYQHQLQGGLGPRQNVGPQNDEESSAYQPASSSTLRLRKNIHYKYTKQSAQDNISTAKR